MVYIGSVRDIDFDFYDAVWYITNTCPNMVVGAEHHPELAPNRYTWLDYRNHKITIEELRDDYLRDLETISSIDVDNLIARASDKDILCVCYCKEYTKCHRGMLYKRLVELGIEVQLIS